MARSTTRLMTTLLAIGAAGLAAQVAAAQQANGAVRDRAARSVDPREQTLRLMNQRLTVSLEDARLEDVMLFLEQAGDLPSTSWIDRNRSGSIPRRVDPPGAQRDDHVDPRRRLEARDEFNQATGN